MVRAGTSTLGHCAPHFFASGGGSMLWSLRGLHWSYCAFIAWASLQTLHDASSDHDVHALLLSSAELIAIVAFLFDRLAALACAALCVVFAVATVITTLEGQVPLRFLYFAATAIYIMMAQRYNSGRKEAVLF
jgi:hypothetical protein